MKPKPAPREYLVTTNTVHFACFRCRKSFKQPGSSNWNLSIAERNFDCPNCKLAMTRLGRHFKAPPQRAIRQWQKVELLYHFGERFHSSRSSLNAWCDTLPATITYLVSSGQLEVDVRRALTLIKARRAKIIT